MFFFFYPLVVGQEHTISLGRFLTVWLHAVTCKLISSKYHLPTLSVMTFHN